MRKKKRLYFISFINARARAFSLTELMISIIVFSIVAGAFLGALVMVLYTTRQTDDMTTMSHEIENSLNSLRWQFTNIGLGMPNNSGKTGSFSVSFTGPNDNQNPIMAYMGDITRSNMSYGGPVTLASGGTHAVSSDMTEANLNNYITGSPDIYFGEELFYAWAVPTGVRLAAKGNGTDEWSALSTAMDDDGWFSSNRNTPIDLKFRRTGDVGRLVNFVSDDLKFGITDTSSTRGASVRSWLLFPSFKVPLLIEENGITDDTIRVRVSPYSYDGLLYNLAGELNGYEEAHLARAACIFVEGERLIQRTYDTMTSYIDKTLATNVSATLYLFDRANRILTMYIVAHGNSAADVRPEENKDYLERMLPVLNFDGSTPTIPDIVPPEHMTRRLFVVSMTWRMKN